MRHIYFSLLFIFLFLSPSRALAQYTKDSIYTHARAGNIEKVKEKLAGGYDQNMLDNTLGAAVVGNHPELVQYLIQKGADMNHLSSFNTSLLINAITYGFDQSALVLIENGANLNVRGFRRIDYDIEIEYNWTPLLCAARTGNMEVVQSLLDHGADPTEKGFSNSPQDIETAADIAAYSGYLDILKLLVKHGAEVSSSTIFKTVRGGHFDTFKFLLKDETNINRIGPAQKTLLMEASWWGRTDMVSYLLKKKADPNIVGKNGQTALLEVLNNPALRQSIQLEIIKKLIRKKADIHFRSPNNQTALSLAQKYKRTDIIQYLTDL